MNVMNTIVFVEDDPEVGSLIAAYLAKHDIEVLIEPRGDLAEETILRTQPELVLLDIMLPGKDGMTICRDLRGRWQGQDCPADLTGQRHEPHPGAGNGRL